MQLYFLVIFLFDFYIFCDSVLVEVGPYTYSLLKKFGKNLR